MSKPWIYVAGPYSSGPVAGVRAAVQAAEVVLAAGGHPIIPNLSLAWDMVSPHPVEFWYAYDLELLSRCDGLLRLGDSAGADREAAEAKHLGLPITYAKATGLTYAIDELMSAIAFKAARIKAPEGEVPDLQAVAALLELALERTKSAENELQTYAKAATQSGIFEIGRSRAILRDALAALEPHILADLSQHTPH